MWFVLQAERSGFGTRWLGEGGSGGLETSRELWELSGWAAATGKKRRDKSRGAPGRGVQRSLVTREAGATSISPAASLVKRKHKQDSAGSPWPRETQSS